MVSTGQEPGAREQVAADYLDVRGRPAPDPEQALLLRGGPSESGLTRFNPLDHPLL